MGTNYRVFEGIRRIVISEFLNNRIIIFPQTMDYANDWYGKRECYRSKKIYNRAKHLVVAAREKQSFLRMQKTYKNATVILVPDIVLSLDYLHLRNQMKIKKVCCCLRKDIESVVDKDIEKRIRDLYGETGLISTAYSNSIRIDEKNRKEVIERCLKKFSSQEVIITDRLHAMIFSYITNTPCVALPNSNGKVEGVYQWIKNKGKVVFCKSAFEKIEFDEKIKNQLLKDEFKPLRIAIENLL